MRALIIVVVFIFSSSYNASCQIDVWRYKIVKDHFYPVDISQMMPEDYARMLSKVWSSDLQLTPEQEQKCYNLVYQHRKTNDSLVKNGVYLNDNQLWSFYNSVDEQLKAVLTEEQYARYKYR